MDGQESARPGLMGDNVIGVYLSNKLLCNLNTISRDPEPKLRHFVHHEEHIHFSRLLGSGEHGVVLLAVIMGNKYALKVVSMPDT